MNIINKLSKIRLRKPRSSHTWTVIVMLCIFLILFAISVFPTLGEIIIASMFLGVIYWLVLTLVKLMRDDFS